MEGDQNLRKSATLGALASVAIVIGIIVVVWLVFFRNSKPDTSKKNTKPNTSQNQQAQGNNSGSANNTSGTGNASTPSSTSGTTAGNGSGQSSATQNKQQLANSGPGDVTKVFVVATVASGSAYYLYIRRREARTNY